MVPAFDRIRLRRIGDASAESQQMFIEEAIELGSLVHTDSWKGTPGAGKQTVLAHGRRAAGSQAAAEHAAAESPNRRIPEAVVAGNAPRHCQS